jgi:5'-3' exonuclease
LVVLFDADSLVYSSCFNSDKDIEGKYLSLDNAFSKFKKKLDVIFEEINELVEVKKFIVCNGSKGNFRKDISKDYKANRTSERPPILSELHTKVKARYRSHYGIGVETDDVVATLWKRVSDDKGVDSVIICSLDKDYKQFPCWFYDCHWKKRTLVKISEQEAIENFYSQMIIGDTADNVNYCKGYGKAYAKKLFKDSIGAFSANRRVYELFKKLYGTESKSKFVECRELLKLKTDCHDRIRIQGV